MLIVRISSEILAASSHSLLRQCFCQIKLLKPFVVQRLQGFSAEFCMVDEARLQWELCTAAGMMGALRLSMACPACCRSSLPSPEDPLLHKNPLKRSGFLSVKGDKNVQHRHCINSYSNIQLHISCLSPDLGPLRLQCGRALGIFSPQLSLQYLPSSAMGLKIHICSSRWNISQVENEVSVIFRFLLPHMLYT